MGKLSEFYAVLREELRTGLALDAVADAFKFIRHYYMVVRNAPTTLRYKLFPRDTARALNAMEVAYSYLQELADSKHPEPADNLHTTSLLSRQIRKAAWFDRDALFDTTENDQPVTFSITKLKVRALEAEASARVLNGQPNKAAAALQQAIRLEPADAHLYYAHGLVLTELSQKRAATKALKQAVRLQPSNIEYRKALDRARHISRSAKAIKDVGSGARKFGKVLQFTLLALGLWLLYSYVLGPAWTNANKPHGANMGLWEILSGLAVWVTLAALSIIVPFLLLRWVFAKIFIDAPIDAYFSLTRKFRR